MTSPEFERELEAAYGAILSPALFESEVEGMEDDDVIAHGIPGAHNRWFSSSQQARKAALLTATQTGPGYRIVHEPSPSLGQPHYHVMNSAGQRVSGHFFYGRRPPRKRFRGRPWREFEQELEKGYREMTEMGRGVSVSPSRLFSAWRAFERGLEPTYRDTNSHGEREYIPSLPRRAFEIDVQNRDWGKAFFNLNGLNMFEMLRAPDGLATATLDELWRQRLPFLDRFNMPRIECAKNTVETRILPANAPGDLQITGQVGEAADFLAEKFAPVAQSINPSPFWSMRLILLECNYYGINDKSHIAYVLASAHHESGMGRFMTEFADGRAYEGRLDLGNTQPGDGPRYKGRGFVQITGRRNYTLYSGIISVTRDPDVDLVNNPQRSAEPVIAAMILAHGMSNGSFTGRRLSDFGVDPNYDFVHARNIVNDLDRANSIAAIARNYRAIMR